MKILGSIEIKIVLNLTDQAAFNSYHNQEPMIADLLRKAAPKGAELACYEAADEDVTRKVIDYIGATVGQVSVIKRKYIEFDPETYDYEPIEEDDNE